MNDFEAIDFFRDNDTVTNPHPYFEALRAQCPVHRENHHNVMMVTGYEEAIEVYNDTATYSSCLSVTGPFPGFPVPLVGDDVSALIEEHRHKLPMSDQLPTLDPPVHTDHRALLMRMITPKRLKDNEEMMSVLVERTLDRFLADGVGEVISGFAGPLTFLVIADLLGVPIADRESFQHGLQHRPQAERAVGSTDDEMAHSPLAFLYAQFVGYVEDRRLNPKDDVLTGMAQATFPDGSIPEPLDVARVAANIFAAGQETTVRLIGAALQRIADDQDLQRRLRADRSLIPNFIEECLRADSPITGDFRLSRTPTTLGGVAIPAGTTMMVINGAANRDPRHFDDPATFDAGRANARQHLAFGRGIHTCPGAPLARAEGRVAIERILDRTSSIRLSEAAHGPADARRFQYAPSFILRGLIALHLEFTATEAAA